MHKHSAQGLDIALDSTRTIGIVGGGQLGLMLGQAAHRLGYTCVFLEDTQDPPAGLVGQVFSSEQLDLFLARADVFTLEFENTPVSVYEFISTQKKAHPPTQALKTAQNRLLEKKMFQALSIETPKFLQIDSKDDLVRALDSIGAPLVVKTAQGGYDGKGQYRLQTASDIEECWQTLGAHTPLIAEQMIDFMRELSIIGARNQDGSTAIYALFENTHKDGILARTLFPAPNQDNLFAQAYTAWHKIAEHLNYVGVLTLELFATQDTIIANEIAPRVHNSGHITMDTHAHSQFDQHIRAVLNLPLGEPIARTDGTMLNIISNYPNLKKLCAIASAKMYHYHKAPRTGRKLGHINCATQDAKQISDLLT